MRTRQATKKTFCVKIFCRLVQHPTVGAATGRYLLISLNVSKHLLIFSDVLNPFDNQQVNQPPAQSHTSACNPVSIEKRFHQFIIG